MYCKGWLSRRLISGRSLPPKQHRKPRPWRLLLRGAMVTTGPGNTRQADGLGPHRALGRRTESTELSGMAARWADAVVSLPPQHHLPTVKRPQPNSHGPSLPSQLASGAPAPSSWRHLLPIMPCSPVFPATNISTSSLCAPQRREAVLTDCDLQEVRAGTLSPCP